MAKSAQTAGTVIQVYLNDTTSDCDEGSRIFEHSLKHSLKKNHYT